MGIRVQCPGCDHSLKVKDRLAGQIGICPECRRRFPIVAAASPPSSMPDGPRWFVRPPDGAQYGPIDQTTLESWVDQGRVKIGTHLWRDDQLQWRAAEDLFDPRRLGWVAEAPPPPAVPLINGPDALAAEPPVSDSVAGSDTATTVDASTKRLPSSRIRRDRARRRRRRLVGGLAAIAVAISVLLAYRILSP